MEILNDISLKKFTTIKIGGIAEKMYIPENETELSELLKNLEEKNEDRTF